MTTKPFKNVESQRVWAIVILLFSIFLIFYPTFTLIKLGSVLITNSILGIIIFLVSAFYLLKTFI